MSFSAFRFACRAVLAAATLSLPGLAVGGEDIRSEQPGAATKNVVSEPQLPTAEGVVHESTKAVPPAGDNAARLKYVLDFAQDAATRIETEIKDYSCILVKRERVEGQVGSYQYMRVKIRHERKEGNNVVVPFSVFLSFLKPERMIGREVLFIQNQNQGDLIARRGGRRSPNMTVQMPPDSPLAMDGNRYPVTEIGFQNLTKRLIEVLENEQKYNDCVIDIFPDAKVDGRKCTHFRLTHHTRRPDLTYCKAEVSVDDELGIPVYYRAFDWPAKEGEPLRLHEEYFYKSVKLNVGLTDTDFAVDNPEYHFQLRDKTDEAIADNQESLDGEAAEHEPSAPTNDGKEDRAAR
jgi:hypothetical protein